MIIIGSTQKNAFIGNGDYSPTLTEAMGKGGGQIPMILEGYALTPKKYESHMVYEQRKNMTKLEPRLSGICGTITTVQKDNYILINNERY